LLLSDGHGTRVTMAAVVRMISHHMKLFLSPPTATELYQALDRVFQDFHKSYRALKLALQGRRLANHKDATMTRDLAVEVIGHVILDGWASKERLQKAWEQVGITLTGLDKFRIRELDLLPERPLKGAIVEHNPALSAADLSLEQMKDAFMQGPSKIESPPKRKGETRLQYSRRRGDDFKAAALHLQLTPTSARDAGLLPHRQEILVLGQEFEMLPAPVKKRTTKHPSSGPIDLIAMLRMHELADVAVREKADRAADKAAAEKPAQDALVAAGILVAGQPVTVRAMKQYCKVMDIKGATALARGDLFACIVAHTRHRREGISD